VLEAPNRSDLRFVVLRDSHLNSHSHYGAVVRKLVAGHDTVAHFPERPSPGQLQVVVYDLATSRGMAGDRQPLLR
jgi:hypothetical protein